jgi:hypothetical protein
MTKLQVVQAIQRRLKVDESSTLDDTGGHWPGAELIDRINESEVEVVRDTGCLYGTSLVSSVASQREYLFDADWGEMITVMWDNKPLQPVMWEQMTWAEGDVGTEAKWRTLTTGDDPIYWGLSEQTGYFFVYKMPTAAETDIMTVFHTIIPTAWTVDDATTGLPFNGFTPLISYHMMLVNKVVSDCLEEDISAVERDGNLVKSSIYRKRYERDVQRLRASVKYPKWALPSWRFPNQSSVFSGPSWGSGRAVNP